jgi:hypothetical protein
MNRVSSMCGAEVGQGLHDLRALASRMLNPGAHAVKCRLRRERRARGRYGLVESGRPHRPVASTLVVTCAMAIPVGIPRIRFTEARR